MCPWLNIVGLALSMIGVVLLFVWAPPQPSSEGMSLGPDPGFM
jgi:hypothetical protein